MAPSKTVLLRYVLCKIFLNIALMSLLGFASIETWGLGGGAPQPKQIVTDFIFFKFVSFTISDVY